VYIANFDECNGPKLEQFSLSLFTARVEQGKKRLKERERERIEEEGAI
jgi:hypothetical protein